MARITNRDCESVVPNRYELVLLAGELARELPSLLAREPDHGREAKTVTALRRTAEHAADPMTLRINRWRRMKDMSLPGESNDNYPQIAPGSSEAQAA